MTGNGSLDRLERHELLNRVALLEQQMQAVLQMMAAQNQGLRHLQARVKRLTDWVEERSLAE